MASGSGYLSAMLEGFMMGPVLKDSIVDVGMTFVIGGLMYALFTPIFGKVRIQLQLQLQQHQSGY
jgi:hypothetical protein